jgi:hypothetical protein
MYRTEMRDGGRGGEREEDGGMGREESATKENKTKKIAYE